jgi:5-methylcytosine-specific restriction enzyme A
MRNKLYDSARWRKVRRIKLAADPLCEICKLFKVVCVADIVDHRIPITAGGPEFPTIDGLASLCIPHHNAKTRAEQLGRPFIPEKVIALDDRGFDANGNPHDPLHFWNQERGR